MYEDGICELGNGEYSVTFGFDDINYQTANKDDQLSIFSITANCSNIMARIHQYKYQLSTDM